MVIILRDSNRALFIYMEKNLLFFSKIFLLQLKQNILIIKMNSITKNKKNIPKTDKTLVLDLDHTLICTYEDNMNGKNLEIYNNKDLYDNFLCDDCPYKSYGIVEGNIVLWGVKRPNLLFFLDFIHKYFENIIVWSAGKKRYVEKICMLIFKENSYPCPKIIWSRDNCEEIFLDRKYLIKPLSKMVEYTNRVNSPVELDLSKMLILDDTEITFYDNVQNGILIPKYIPSYNKDPHDILRNKDDYLLKFCDWCLLNDVVNSVDVRSLNKRNVFSSR